MDETFIRIDKCTRERESVRIPVEIEGMPVRAIGPDVFNESDVVQEIVCPDGVEAIGPCAFRFLESNQRMVVTALAKDLPAANLHKIRPIGLKKVDSLQGRLQRYCLQK